TCRSRSNSRHSEKRSTVSTRQDCALNRRLVHTSACRVVRGRRRQRSRASRARSGQRCLVATPRDAHCFNDGFRHWILEEVLTVVLGRDATAAESAATPKRSTFGNSLRPTVV